MPSLACIIHSVQAAPFDAKAAIRKYNPWLLALAASPIGISVGLVLYTTDGPFVMVPTAVLLLWAAVVWVYLRRPYVKGFLGVGVL
jgi:hypothetical protein